MLRNQIRSLIIASSVLVGSFFSLSSIAADPQCSTNGDCLSKTCYIKGQIPQCIKNQTAKGYSAKCECVTR